MKPTMILSEETADALVLYRDANALYNRIYEYFERQEPENTARAEELFAPFADPAKKTLSALLDIVNNNISWALADGKSTTV